MNLPSHRTPRGLAIPVVTAADLARRLDGLLEGDSSAVLSGVTTLHSATEADVCFHQGSDWTGEARTTLAGLVLAPFGITGLPSGVKAVLQVKDPYAAMLKLLRELHEPLRAWPEAKMAWDADIHPSAVVEGQVWPGAHIGPNCVVAQGAEVGWNTVLEANVTLYPGVSVGNDCVLQAGVVVGSRGFGFHAGEKGLLTVPHYAGVELGDNVQLGANSVVAAGFLEPTRIAARCRMDSFVQVAHNCQVGEGVLMACRAGLAGSVVVGAGSEFGAEANVAQHVRIGAKVRVAARSGITHDVADGVTVAGFPAVPIAEWRRSVVALRRLGNDANT